MKMVLDERLKHRLVGLAVVLSLGAIFVPAIVKQSGSRFDDRKSMAIAIPAKPVAPQVKASNEPALFKRMTVAHVTLPSVQPELKPVATLARAEPLSQMNDAPKPVAVEPVRETVTVAETQPAIAPQPSRIPPTPVMSAKPVTVSVAAKKQPPPPRVTVAQKPQKIVQKGFAVQLGMFTQQRNATALVARLKSKGYKAWMVKVNNKNGTAYRVLAGQTQQRQDAQRLQQRLAVSERVSGYIVASNGVG